jgi:hypothetical protein
MVHELTVITCVTREIASKEWRATDWEGGNALQNKNHDILLRPRGLSTQIFVHEYNQIFVRRWYSVYSTTRWHDDTLLPEMYSTQMHKQFTYASTIQSPQVTRYSVGAVGRALASRRRAVVGVPVVWRCVCGLFGWWLLAL